MSLRRYGVELAVHVAPGRPLFALLAARTPAAPLFIYTLAAEYDLYALAAHASGFLLGTSPAEIPQECADRMGAAYLHRLLALQVHRREAMREVLRALPRAHPVTRRCGAEAQQRLANAWLLTSGYLIWEGRPDLTTTSMSVTFEGVGASIQCEMCRACFFERIEQALTAWAGLARTI
ncbi:hypothetical protein PsYK624_078710 [Phanerochaete sordida]|uniref:Uncharacterized protein n=1 Tax=Phanerochaete sordida TaxID=48140 RepID=A0A9P3LDP1_9APHY|nr:hypothetical protein PsYK624_078710 [Phanerochaete sordida]